MGAQIFQAITHCSTASIIQSWRPLNVHSALYFWFVSTRLRSLSKHLETANCAQRPLSILFLLCIYWGQPKIHELLRYTTIVGGKNIERKGTGTWWCSFQWTQLQCVSRNITSIQNMVKRVSCIIHQPSSSPWIVSVRNGFKDVMADLLPQTLNNWFFLSKLYFKEYHPL